MSWFWCAMLRDLKYLCGLRCLPVAVRAFPVEVHSGEVREK
jgi:hypothetical protein